jgi:hypothetical protein
MRVDTQASGEPQVQPSIARIDGVGCASPLRLEHQPNILSAGGFRQHPVYWKKQLAFVGAFLLPGSRRQLLILGFPNACGSTELADEPPCERTQLGVSQHLGDAGQGIGTI